MTGVRSLLYPSPSGDATGSHTRGEVEPERPASRSRWWLVATAVVAVAAVAAAVFLRPTSTGVAAPAAPNNVFAHPG